MFASVTLTSQRSAMILALPSDAIQRDGDKRYVFTAPNDSTFVKRYIETGAEKDQWIEVLGGLKEGEKVVTHGTFALKSEMLKESFGGGE
jgi:multidrug efflux pump subunit AcrA (membrane-fusion protein)